MSQVPLPPGWPQQPYYPPPQPQGVMAWGKTISVVITALVALAGTLGWNLYKAPSAAPVSQPTANPQPPSDGGASHCTCPPGASCQCNAGWTPPRKTQVDPVKPDPAEQGATRTKINALLESIEGRLDRLSQPPKP